MIRSFLVLAVFFLSACAPSSDGPVGTQPADGAQIAGNSSSDAWSKGAMVVAANPHAVAAAIEILAKGGHAVDAAIAAHVVLGLVEPQSSGLGGGGFMLVYDRTADDLSAYDGRETAPAGASETMFQRDGKTLNFLDAWQSGVSVGVPGVVAMYRLAHDEHGKLPWADVFQPAIRLATDGFAVSPRMAGWLRRMARPTRLDDNPQTAAYFFPGGKVLQAGHWLKNPEYAETLRRIASDGPQAFYSGALAEQMAAAAQAAPDGGTLSVADIENYRAVKRAAICGGFRDMTICSAPPPSSGLAQILIAGLYEHLVVGATSQNEKVQAFVDAQRLAYADRDHFVADPAFVAVPTAALVNPEYIRHRASERFPPDATPTPGDPAAVSGDATAAVDWGADTTREIGGTTHLSIIDQQGNAVALTASIEAPFGSSRWVGGFLLNNEMTDFARQPSVDGRVVANAVAPGKRPRSSMSPVFVFDKDHDLLMVSGSPGGHSIPAFVAKTTIGVLDWDLSAQQAVDFPSIIARGVSVRVEVADAAGQQIATSLKAMGYAVRESKGEDSGIHLIVVRADGLEGAADKRREGSVGVIGAN